MAKKSKMSPLSLEQMDEFAHELRANAVALMEDAIYLKNAGRLARAASLSVLAIEEGVKAMVAIGISMRMRQGKDVDWASHEKFFFSHASKLNLSHVLTSLISSTITSQKSGSAPSLDAETIRKMLEESQPHTSKLDHWKQDGFYVQVVDGTSKPPTASIDDELARGLMSYAKSRLVAFDFVCRLYWNSLKAKDEQEQTTLLKWSDDVDK